MGRALPLRTIYTIKAFQEHLSVDEVETRATWCAEVANDEVDATGAAPNGRVQEALLYAPSGQNGSRCATSEYIRARFVHLG